MQVTSRRLTGRSYREWREVWLVLTLGQGVDGQMPSDVATSESWPFRSVLDLGVNAREVQRARQHARLLLQEHGLSCLSGDVEILVSELVPVFAHGISLREPAGPADVDFEEVE
jgi:hypothetical protein